MYHSLTFKRKYTTPYTKVVTKNTYDDLKLVPSSRPVISAPALKEVYVDIPGANGSIDLSEVVSGCPVYQNREGDLEFVVLNGNYTGFASYDTWINRYTEILNFLHGREIEMSLEDDPDYYYRGRFSVDEWESAKDYSLLKIKYNLEPFKWASKSSLETKQQNEQKNRYIDSKTKPSFQLSSPKNIFKKYAIIQIFLLMK